MSKKFDWEQCKVQHSAKAYQFLKQVHDQPLTQEEFVKLYMALPSNKNKVSQTKPRKRYVYLKKNFGFFKGGK